MVLYYLIPTSITAAGTSSIFESTLLDSYQLFSAGRTLAAAASSNNTFLVSTSPVLSRLGMDGFGPDDILPSSGLFSRRHVAAMNLDCAPSSSVTYPSP